MFASYAAAHRDDGDGQSLGGALPSERIRGELRKLGTKVSKRTIQKSMRRVRKPRAPSGQTWSTFLDNHVGDTFSCDSMWLYDELFRPIFAFFIAHHATRGILQFNVTRSSRDRRWPADFPGFSAGGRAYAQFESLVAFFSRLRFRSVLREGTICV